MQAQQKNNFRQHKCVPACLAEHEAACADIPAFMKVRDEYEKKIAYVARLDKNRDTVAAGIVEDRNVLRVILQHETMRTAGILSVHAVFTGDPE